MTLLQLVIISHFSILFIRRTNACFAGRWIRNVTWFTNVLMCSSFVFCIVPSGTVVSFMKSVTTSCGMCVYGRKWWDMLSNVINDIININKIPSSYIVEHVPAICLLRERLILSTVAIPMEFCSLLCVGAVKNILLS